MDEDHNLLHEEYVVDQIDRPRNRLAHLRELGGPSRKDLASKVSSSHGGRRGEQISERTIARWESGETTIPEKHWARLAEIFGVSASYLLGLDDGENGNGESEEVA